MKTRTPYLHRSAIALILCCLHFTSLAGNHYPKNNKIKKIVTQVSGIVNIYTPIVTIDNNPCTPSVNVENSSGFFSGDKVLIIQMQGASIDQTNTAQYGTMSAYNNAGNYEFSRIKSINGPTIYLLDTLVRSYTLSGKVQLVKVPEYQDVDVTGALSGSAWNGSSGGVIALAATGSMTLNAPVVASQLGFRGAIAQNAATVPTFHVTDYVGINTSPGYFAPKGEGIAAYGVTPLTNGKGAPANGGGGGNNHNAGGGGGANIGDGGNGGYGWQPMYTGNYLLSQGLGGKKLINPNNQVFLGGGGGAGHINQNDNSSGGRGGGIIILVANLFVSGNQPIISDGAQGGDALPDGAGGGGSGGTVVIAATTFSGNCTINCRGGRGGNNVYTGGGIAPGGGGGGGGVYLSSATVPAGFSTSTIGGPSGLVTVNGTTFGAGPGTDGSNFYNVTIPENKPILGTTKADAGSDKFVCPGKSELIGVSPISGNSYQWTPSTELDNPTISNPICTPSNTRQYILKMTNSFGCNSYDTTVISVDRLVAEISPVIPVCLGTSVQLAASTGAKLYRWEPPTELSDPNISNPVCYPSQTRSYILTVESIAGCISYDTVVIPVSSVVAKVTSASPICLGSSTKLSASGGDKYTWSPATGLNDSTSATPTASPKITTKYKVLVTNGYCSDSAYITVDVIQPIATAGQDKTICLGASAQIGAAPVTGDTYSWEPTTGLNDPFIANPIASPSVLTRYILASTRNGCTAYDTVTVNIGTIKASVQASPDTICKGEKAQLSASGGSEYRWEPTTGLDNPTIANPVASPAVTTNYKVIVSSGKCIDTGYVTLQVNSAAKANAGSDKTICPGSSAQIGMLPEAGVTYSWLPTTDLDNPSSSNPIASSKTNIDYILTTTGEGGCISRDTVHISVGNIVAKVSNDTAICSGTPVQLLSSGGAQYRWTPSIGLNDSTVENPIATLSTTTTYKVFVLSGTCKDSAIVTITVRPSPAAHAGADQTLCNGSFAQIGEAAQAGNIYSWQPATGLNDTAISNPVASPAITTQYILTVTGQGGCVAHDTVVVTVGKIKALVSNDTAICNGASAQLFAGGGTQYDWSPLLGLNDPASANPIASPNITTKYRVIVTTGTCIDTAFVTVSIIPAPNADAGGDKIICIGESTQIGAPADSGNTYSWSPLSGIISPTSSQTIVSPSTTTTYTLTVTNPAGCVKTDEVLVTVNLKNERSFILWPDSVTFTPGVQFTSSLTIPSEVSDWRVRLKYDSLVVKFSSISGGLHAIPDDQKGELTVSGAGGGGAVTIRFDAYLPHNADSVFDVRLTLDTAQFALCETVSTTGNSLKLADYCARSIRAASGTGQSYFLAVKGNTIDFGVGLSGNVRLEVFDYIGNSVLVVSEELLEAGQYSTTLDLPVGVYYCRMRAGLYEQVGKVLIAR
ncbi:MAG: hypothetical protein IPM69_03610 [Ignavibacteria bacterium]|nr:hypothetical protein [Ignavibacteria bacterium]